MTEERRQWRQHTAAAGNEEAMAVAGDELAHAQDAHAHDAHEEVTSPDQHRRTVSPRLARLGAILTIIILPLMALFGNHQGGVEKVLLLGIAGLILLMLVLDVALRKAGLRS